jgi:hypothetical protein
MSDQNSVTQYVPADDGWGDAAAEGAERMIKGRILKFADWRWTAGKEAEEVASGTKLVAMATSAAWIRWEEKRPVEYRIRQPGQRLPERKELGYDDETKWEQNPSGEPQDPWCNTRAVYLVDPETLEAFTFSTSSFGGRQAVIDLGDQIARMRTVHSDAVPIVALQAAEMPTKFGRKSKPVFKVMGWKTANAGAAIEDGGKSKPAVTRTAPIERQLSKREEKEAERTSLKREIDDDIDIPF